MPKIFLNIQDGKVVGASTEGMKAKPIPMSEKIRRGLTRKRALNLKIKWERLNAPIVFPNIKE